MIVKVKKLSPLAVLPQNKKGDAGWDLTAISETVIADEKGTFGYVEYKTGLAFEIPEKYVGYIFPRSSISKTGLLLANAVGVIDSTYRGEVSLRFKHIARTHKYAVGDRVGQLIIMPIPEIEFEETNSLTETERGEGAYGSTGN